MKTMRIEDLSTFPFPTPPDPAALAAAENRLLLLGALARRPEVASSGGGLPGESRHCHVTVTSLSRHCHVTATSLSRHCHVTVTSLSRH